MKNRQKKWPWERKTEAAGPPVRCRGTGRGGRTGKAAVLCALVFLGIAGLAGCQKEEPAADPISRSTFLLNTFVSVTLYDSQDESLLEGSLELCRQYEELFSTTIETSEISRINDRDPEETVITVSEETAKLIQKGLDYGELTGGAFDITIEPVSSLWDFSGSDAALPDAEALEEAVRRVDYRTVHVDGDQVILDSPDTAIDLGAIAKGYIADRIKDYLLENGVRSATINLGGNVLCVGTRPDGTPFRIGLQMPFADRNETIAILNIDDLSVVTSGVYERYFTLDGVTYHHLLNPEDGCPYQNGLLAVTVVSPLSVDGDALSTSCFALGLEKGMELAESMDGVYAYFITDDYEIHYSEGARELLSEP